MVDAKPEGSLSPYPAFELRDGLRVEQHPTDKNLLRVIVKQVFDVTGDDFYKAAMTAVRLQNVES